MHFWINKPAGRNYGFGGRRYPCASSASKGRSGHRGRRGRDIGPMVTPVHRFQSLNGSSLLSVHDCPPGPSVAGRPRHQRHLQQQQQQWETNHRPIHAQQLPPSAAVPDSAAVIASVNEETRDSGISRFRGSRSNVVISNNVTNAAAAAAAGGGTVDIGNNGSNVNSERAAVLTNETTNNGLNRAGFLDFSEISDTELAGYRLRCGVWITFVLATGFVSVAKFYFSNRDAGLDMLIFCGLLFTLLLSGCFYSTFFRRAQNNHRHREHLEPDSQRIATLAAALTLRDENARNVMQQQLNHRLQQQQLSLQVHMQQQQQQHQQQQQPPPPPPPPPPPYHIAILIPPVNSPEEAPPPSYDKAMNEEPGNHTRVFIFSKEDEN